MNKYSKAKHLSIADALHHSALTDTWKTKPFIYVYTVNSNQSKAQPNTGLGKTQQNIN